MTEPCEDCAVGRIGSVRIRASEWIEANTAFLAVTQHFNDHTGREALFYPGVVVGYRFCGDCGSPVTARAVPWPEGTKGCTREEYLRWFSDHVIPGFASKYGVEQV